MHFPYTVYAQFFNTMNDSLGLVDLVDSISNYIQVNYRESIKRFISNNDLNLLPINISAHNLFNISPLIADILFNNPCEFLRILENVENNINSKINLNPCLSVKRVKIRIISFPAFPNILRLTSPRVDDVNKFLIIEGKIIGITKVRQMFYKRKFQCKNCEHKFEIDVDIIKPPNFNFEPNCCPSPNDCNSKNFLHIEDKCTDYQEIVVQEITDSLNSKGMMNSITVFLQDELVDIFKPGDHVIILGVLSVRFKSLNPNSFIDSHLFVRANNVFLKYGNVNFLSTFTASDFIKFWDLHKRRGSLLYARDMIVNSLCPQLYGLGMAKLAVLLGIIGGTQISDQTTGIKQRGESHILLVGDPGCGKSQLLKQACVLVPKSIFTSGTGTTSAGLTASVVKEAGVSHWNLEAGALPSVNHGICCIDEFNSLKKADKISIHEAMEQQTISVAKAGIICHLKTQVSIIAACNMNQSKSGNLCDLLDIPSPLLSRFDIIVLLKDHFNETQDELIADFVLNDKKCTETSDTIDQFPWSIDILKSYITLINDLRPRLTEESSSILKKYYQHCRMNSDRDTSRTTIRMLESLTRLATAHAKLMFHSEVLIDDALAAVDLMHHSISIENMIGNMNIEESSNEIIDDSFSRYRNILNILNIKQTETLEILNCKSQESKKKDEDIIHLLDENKLPSQSKIKNIPKSPSKAKNILKSQSKTLFSSMMFDIDENYFDTNQTPNNEANNNTSKRTFHDTLNKFKNN